MARNEQSKKSVNVPETQDFFPINDFCRTTPRFRVLARNSSDAHNGLASTPNENERERKDETNLGREVFLSRQMSVALLTKVV